MAALANDKWIAASIEFSLRRENSLLALCLLSLVVGAGWTYFFATGGLDGRPGATRARYAGGMWASRRGTFVWQVAYISKQAI